MRTTTLFLVLASTMPAVSAQPNAVPGKDARLFVVEQLNQAGRMGTFPAGRNGLTVGVRICNVGKVDIDWRAPMNPLHPFYAFIVCRAANGRFEQISDRSYLKHGFLSTNSNECGVCRTFAGTLLGPGCSDAYSSSLNSDPYYLGPATEVDPWLGAWNPVCSHFDRGEPPVAPAQQCDGNRSLSFQQAAQLNPVTHRIEVDDADLNVAGATFYYGSYAVITGEHEQRREDNGISRAAAASWTGLRWQFTNASPLTNGSILQHWAGAQLTSNSNANDDGRFYVAVKVTGPDSRGLWRYEFAVQNRDNSRGAASFRVPICPEARILNASFRDIDKTAANDWTVSVTSGEVAFLATAQNALEWNTIYNFGFDSDAAPGAGQVTLDQARPGPGAGNVAVNTQVPSVVHNQYLGNGCGAPAPSLVPSGSPPLAQIPNPTFGVRLEGLAPSAAAALFVSVSGASLNLGNGCFLWIGIPPIVTVPLSATPAGIANVPMPIPNQTALEGAELFVQGTELVTGGPLFGMLELTNGLKIRVGNQLVACP